MPHFLARQGARGRNAQRLGDAMRALLARAGVADRAAQDTADRVLVVHTIGDAAVAASPEGAVAPEALRASYATGLGWLLRGALRAREH